MFGTRHGAGVLETRPSGGVASSQGGSRCSCCGCRGRRCCGSTPRGSRRCCSRTHHARQGSRRSLSVASGQFARRADRRQPDSASNAPSRARSRPSRRGLTRVADAFITSASSSRQESSTRRAVCHVHLQRERMAARPLLRLDDRRVGALALTTGVGVRDGASLHDRRHDRAEDVWVFERGVLEVAPLPGEAQEHAQAFEAGGSRRGAAHHGRGVYSPPTSTVSSPRDWPVSVWTAQDTEPPLPVATECVDQVRQPPFALPSTFSGTWTSSRPSTDQT